MLFLCEAGRGAGLACRVRECGNVQGTVRERESSCKKGLGIPCCCQAGGGDHMQTLARGLCVTEQGAGMPAWLGSVSGSHGAGYVTLHQPEGADP